MIIEAKTKIAVSGLRVRRRRAAKGLERSEGQILPFAIGVEDGMNLYAYVENDPLNLRDPMGLFRDTVATAGKSLYNNLASELSKTNVGIARQPLPDWILTENKKVTALLCVQRRLACSAGDRPAGVEISAP